MADLVPWAILEVCTDVEAFGEVTYQGDSMTWPVANLFSDGRPGNTFSGFCLDPSGDYLMQSPVPIWQDSKPDQWPTKTGSYGQGAGGSDVGGVQMLRQTNPAGAFSAAHTYSRAAEEGLTARFWIGQAPPGGSAVTFYVQFSTAWRLALEPGYPIRLQRYVSAAWQDVMAASALGECESYLSSVGGWLWVDVLPETDPGWYTGLPATAAASSPPPNRLCVSLNGSDAVLTVPCNTFPGGALTVSGQNRQWAAVVAKKRFAITCAATLETQVRVADLTGTPTVAPLGYVPASNSGLSGTVSIGAAPNQAYATLAVSVPSGGKDSTGYAVKTVYLAAVTADWAPVEVAPSVSPSWVAYRPTQVEARAWWVQASNTARAAAEIEFVDTDGSFAPGAAGVLPAVRAARLWLGCLPKGVTPTTSNLTKFMTGYLGKRKNGFRWRWEGKQCHVTVCLDDRLIMADTTPCGYQPAYDGTSHYWAMGRLARRVGFTTGDLNFPASTKYQTGYYALKWGTAQHPAMQPDPQDMVMDAMQEVRGDAADIDGTTGQIQPMVLGTDADGKLDYFPMAVGMAYALANPGSASGLSPVQAFSVFPQFDGFGEPILNELHGVESVADLSNIRSEAVFEGIDLQSGGVNVGYFFNTGATSDPTQFGYIGAVRSPYIQISRRNTSLDVVERQALIAAVQLRYPSIQSFPRGHLQPYIFILTLFTIQEPFTQGTTLPVPYACHRAVHSFASGEDERGNPVNVGWTQLGGQLLGEAGG